MKGKSKTKDPPASLAFFLSKVLVQGEKAKLRRNWRRKRRCARCRTRAMYLSVCVWLAAPRVWKEERRRKRRGVASCELELGVLELELEVIGIANVNVNVECRYYCNDIVDYAG